MDHHQVIQLASLTCNVLKVDNIIVGGGDVKNTCAIKSIQKYIYIPAFDPGLKELNKIIHDKFKAVICETYGTFCSPNTTVISKLNNTFYG